MPIQPHIIQLRGPWQIDARNQTGTLLFEGRINVRSGTEWHGWTQGVKSADEIASVSFSRSFNWPEPKSVPARIELVIEGHEPRRIEINDQDFATTTSNSRHVSCIQGQLLSHNKLSIFFDMDDRKVGHLQGLVRAVYLQIHDTSDEQRNGSVKP